MPEDTGNWDTWFRTLKTDRVLKHDPMARDGEKAKRRCTRVGLWTARHGHTRFAPTSRQQLIIADFDNELPPAFQADDWDSFYNYSKELINQNGLVIRSVSGKVKIIFVVELPKSGPLTITKAIALESLNKLLPIDLFDYIDKNDSAHNKCFVNPKIISMLIKHLPHLKVHQAALGEDVYLIQDKQLPKVKKEPLREYKDPIPKELLPFISGKRPQQKERFLRILLETQALIGYGFDLACTKISKQLGVSNQCILDWISEAIALEWLFILDPTVKVGKKAKTYGADGDLLAALQSHPKATLLRKDPLPSLIPDGEWENYIIGSIRWRFLRDEEAFRDYFGSLPGATLKDRPTKLEQAIKLNRNYLEYKLINRSLKKAI